MKPSISTNDSHRERGGKFQQIVYSTSTDRSAETGPASTPAKKVPTTTLSPITDNWAAITKMPTTSTSRRQPRTLLSLLLQKDNPDIEQVQAELHVTQSKMKALQKINEELRTKADEAEKVAHDTRLLMARLMRTACVSQGTLVKLVTTIVNYQLTHEEKIYLYSLVKDNNNMTDQLRRDYSNFFQRIFVDSDEDFDTWAQNVADAINAVLKTSTITSSDKSMGTEAESAKSISKESVKSPPPSAPLTTERSTLERSTAALPAVANLMSGALSSSPQPLDQTQPDQTQPDQTAPYEFLVQLARAAPTGQIWNCIYM